MRIKIKTEHYTGETKESIKFAWLPVVVGDYLVWFERYRLTKVWTAKPRFNRTVGSLHYHFGWDKIRELL